jgi:DNA-binding NtrC family response regulator
MWRTSVSSPGGSQTVLVVDDEQSLAEMIAAILRKSGYVSHIAHSAEEALRLLDTITPHVLVSDVTMPGMDGVQLGIQLRKRCPECKVLLCSGATTSENALEERRKQGYDFKFLKKPFHAADLLRSIAD